jgi:hypothetical protein
LFFCNLLAQDVHPFSFIRGHGASGDDLRQKTFNSFEISTSTGNPRLFVGYVTEGRARYCKERSL